MTIKFSLKLLDSDSKIRLEILSELKILLDKALIKLANRIEPKIRILLRQSLQNEPEYGSLINGVLRKEFGIADVGNVDIAINNIVNSTELSIQSTTIKGSRVSGGIILSIVPKSLSGIIDDPSAFVIDNERGYSLPWLEWLLTKGGSIIIRNFEVQYGPNPRSRSGDAIMISSGSNWRVPSEFSGTSRNNWITRALSTIETKIAKVLEDELRAIL
jgi:hypothetical protein